MHLRQSLRFKGYWLGLLAWLMLSFGSATASAFVTSEMSWLRLCTVSGVTWQQTDSVHTNNQQPVCDCLTHTVVINSAPVALPFFTPYQDTVASTVGEKVTTSFHPAQPRAPPVTLLSLKNN